jgi:hypothetical protein
MRRVVFLACLLACAELGCADYRQKPIFPEGAAHRAVVNEQALLGLSAAGDALAAQLVDADGEPPQLWLAVFDARGGPTRKVLEAPETVARNISTQLQREGETPAPLLEGLVRAGWPEAVEKARALGFAAAEATPAGGGQKPARGTESAPLRGEISIAGNGESLLLRFARDRGPPPMLVLILSERDHAYEAEVARMPLAGEPVAPKLYLHGGVAWFVSGSYRKGAPLHRAVGLRRADLRRGEAQIDNVRGLDAAAAGDLDYAREVFAGGIAADPGYADVLYDAAAAAALMNDDAAAVALLVRAAAADPARVQVLGRNDPALRELRKRKDVRDLLGQRRPPPENVSAPP